jgi:cytochrome c
MRRSAAVLIAVVLAAGMSALPSAAAAPDDQSPPPASSFQKVTLNDRPGEPMSLAVLPDLRGCTPPAPARCGSTTPGRG